MANRPFLATAQVVLTAGNAGIASYRVSEGQKFTVKRLLQQATGAANITGIILNNGDTLTNASPSLGIPLEAICDVASDNNVPADLPDPLVLVGGSQINFNLLDTSGAGNTIKIMMWGYLEG